MRRTEYLLELILDELKTSNEMAGKRTDTLEIDAVKHTVEFNIPYSVAGTFIVIGQAWDSQGHPVAVRIPQDEITKDGFAVYSPIACTLNYTSTLKV